LKLTLNEYRKENESSSSERTSIKIRIETKKGSGGQPDPLKNLPKGLPLK